MYENLKCLSPEELSYLAVTIAVTLAKELDEDSIAVVNSLCFLVGATLGLIAKQRELLAGALIPIPNE